MRLATISELPKDLLVDTQIVKGISGGDTQTARFLHQEYFDFDLHAQLLIATNFYPYADPEDTAYFRRVAIMRFPVCFTDKQPDKHLAFKLKGKADGILTWMIEGLRQYLEEGLHPTPQKALPTANPVTTSAISSGDYERVRQDFTSKQQALKPIKPASLLGN